MALFKIFKGAENLLNSVPMHEGYAYFCEDSGNLYVDISDTDGDRVLVSADAALRLVKRNSDGSIVDGSEIDVDDIVRTTDIIDVAYGGTGATSADGARDSLDVYSRGETNDEVDKVTTRSFEYTIPAGGWTLKGEIYEHSYANANLKCGKNGDVPPIITYKDNLEEYSKIETATATVGTGILFTAKEEISGAIPLIIIDVK